MKIVKRTPSYDPDDHNVIIAAGKSSQTDCAAFIEQQKKLLLECKRSKVSVPTEAGVTRKSNDEGTDGEVGGCTARFRTKSVVHRLRNFQICSDLLSPNPYHYD